MSWIMIGIGMVLGLAVGFLSGLIVRLRSEVETLTEIDISMKNLLFALRMASGIDESEYHHHDID